MRIDPADPSKQIPDDRLTVIDLTAPEADPGQPPALGDRRGAQGRRRRRSPRSSPRCRPARAPPASSINKAGTLALVANRAEGTVSVFTIAGTKVDAGRQGHRRQGEVGAEPRGVRARRQERAGDARWRSPHLRADHRRHQGGADQARDRRGPAPLWHRHRRQGRGGRGRQRRRRPRRCRHHQRHRPQGSTRRASSTPTRWARRPRASRSRPTASSSPSPS